MSWWVWNLWLVAAFLCGSVPFAVLIARSKGVDLRQHGSGNPGATNLGRAVGKKWGLLCFVLDVGKGLVPTLLFLVPLADGSLRERYELHPQGLESVSNGDAWRYVQWVLVAIAATLGHVFSPWLKFRGGKGVATGLGGALGLFPVVTVPGLLAFGLWYATCKATGYVGLASVVAAGALPVMTLGSCLLLGLTPGETAVFVGLTALLAAVVIARHRGNLARIRAGTEPKARWTGKT
ncbi:MAG: glycerol-3-phosphate acyltransferase [Planctomycetota bacterium]